MTIIVTDQYILLSITAPDDRPLSWEYLQKTKEAIFPGLTFVEIYPEESNVVNNINQRHLYHLKNVKLPCLTELEGIGADCSVFISENK